MATRRNRRPRRAARADALIAFEALAIEGGLLSPEWLSQVAQLKASDQGDADYDVPRGLNLRDEIGRYWRVAQAAWSDFVAARNGKADGIAVAEAFVVRLLKDSFGFSSLLRTDAVTLSERSYPVGFSGLDGRVPVVIAPAGLGLDVLHAMFGEVGRRRSAFGLAQEYLNAQDGALWGLVTDGLTLRIVRDNASLTRPAWIEVDVARLFTEERYADFAALWLLMHASRFGRASQPVAACPLEVWRTAGREEGTRAREHLRRGVEDALLALGQGFLSHPDNVALRAALHDGSLSTSALFNQLLRLVYRLIFLLTVEERGLLHPEGTPDAVKALYAGGYSLRRLRERSVRRSAHDRFVDLWQVTRLVTGGVAQGEPRLGLPALAGLFAADQCAALDSATLDNRSLLTAMFKLSWLKEDGSLARVNWRDMGPEELGSVYESLLELVPQVTGDGRGFTFAGGDATQGNARKTSGSYYTPDSLVQVLLDSALEPVIADTIAKNPQRTVEALLELSIVDPACGSGHFLLGAARRLATHVARLQANGTPSAAEYRHALRQVVGRCIYGVDLNPMAVELCKVSLWMEAVEPGLPLTFLNAHIQHGNALLGTTPELMKGGIPDAAWDPIEGDDKNVAKALKKRNKEEGRGLLSLPLTPPKSDEAAAVTRAVADLEAASDVDLAALAKKESRWSGILDSPEYRHQKLVADSWCAAFVWPKQLGALAVAAPTLEVWRQLRDGRAASALTVGTVNELADRYHFFHWHLQFPRVFERGGFDVVLGNPPWESLRLSEIEFFSVTAPKIADAENSAQRKRLITELETENPLLYKEFSEALNAVEGFNAFVVRSAHYPLCGVGRINLFSLFAEVAYSLVSNAGRIGQVLPSGIVTDDSTKLFFQCIIKKRQLVSFFDFENREALFKAVDRTFKFGVITIAGGDVPTAEAEFVFFATRVDHLKESDRRFTLGPEDLMLLNPMTKTCPVFRSQRHAVLTICAYRRWKTLQDSGWDVSPRFPLDIGRESGEFRSVEIGTVPLYESKYFHQFDHRWATHSGDDDRGITESEKMSPVCSITPRYAYPAASLALRYDSTWKRPWMLCWRDITKSVNERTLIASVVPSLAISHTAWLLIPAPEVVSLVPTLLSMLNSFALDFVVRQKIGGTHLNKFVFEQLPLVSPTTFNQSSSVHHPALHEWIHPRVLELTYTAWDLEPFAHDVGYDGPPFRWDTERRFLLRCELDAAFFHLYGLSRDDTDYVMETFPIVKRHDERDHGEFRTKRVILEIYDAMAEAARTGTAYQTRLDPPPADPRVAHPDREGKVVPLRPAMRPAAVTNLAAVAEGGWARSRTFQRGEIHQAIRAVLEARGGAMDRRQARLAALLVLEPHLLMPQLDDAERAQWVRTVGADATKGFAASIGYTAREWGAVLAGLRARGQLAEDLGENTWILAADAVDIDTSGWPAGRAAFVLNALERLESASARDAFVSAFPAVVQELLRA